MTLAQFEKKLNRRLDLFEKILLFKEKEIMQNVKVYEGEYWVSGKSEFMDEDEGEFETDGKVQVIADNYEQAIEKIKSHAMIPGDLEVKFESFELVSLKIIAEPES